MPRGLIKRDDLPELAAEWALAGLRGRGGRSVSRRVPAERRRYAEDPWAAARDIYGLELVPQQEELLEAVMRHDRLLWQAANNTGKTFLGGFLACWVFDCRGALEGDGVEERGARILLPGPDHPTVLRTIYAAMMSHARRAESRGYEMPGRRSELSVLWQVGPEWVVEAFSPPNRPTQRQAHSAAGRHHVEQWAIIEEGQGVAESVWSGVEGMCSSEGNRIIAASNPTEAYGPFFTRTKSRGWKTVILSAFDHPNIRERRSVVPSAVGLRVTEQRIRDWCHEVGPYPTTHPDSDHQDFIYALPPGNEAGEPAPRDDGQLGHADGELRVYRPSGPHFAPKVLGLYPASDDAGLFSAALWDAAVRRWSKTQQPPGPPDRVGVDVASTGEDTTQGAPAWGPDAHSLLSDWAEAMAAPTDEARLEELRARPIYVGELQMVGSGRSGYTAGELHRLWPRSHWVLENIGDAKSVADHTWDVIGHRELTRFNPSGSAPPTLPEEIVPGNARAAAYIRAAMLVSRGLVVPPDNPLLREEILATELRFDRHKKIDGQTIAVAHVVDRRWITHRLGRSPDRASAFVLALWQPELGDDGDWFF